MDFKKTVINLLISLLLSPVIVYIFLTLARMSGADYNISHGESFIIWLLMALVINQSIVRK